jgi:ribonuclease P protein subunit RPR2
VLKEIIHTLESAVSGELDPEVAQRWTELARKLSMKSRVRIPSELKHFVCHGCKGALIPRVTATFRTRSRREPHITITCLRCGHICRKPLRRRDGEQ